MRITPEVASEIWALLVEHAGAKNDEYREAEFVRYVTDKREEDFAEYRFGGLLGHGGKFNNKCGNWYVSYYVEDHTPAKAEIRQKVNDLLSKLLARELEKMIEVQGLRNILKDFMGYLKPDDAKIMTARLGLDDGKIKSFGEIEQMFGVNREQCLEIQTRALKTIKRRMGTGA